MFMYTILTNICKILQHWYHNICVFIVTYFIVVSFQLFWCQIPEGGEITGPKHVGAMQKNVRTNYRIVHFLVLHELWNKCTSVFCYHTISHIAQDVYLFCYLCILHKIYEAEKSKAARNVRSFPTHDIYKCMAFSCLLVSCFISYTLIYHRNCTIFTWA